MRYLPIAVVLYGVGFYFAPILTAVILAVDVTLVWAVKRQIKN
jgi:hypothetical protein